MLRPFLCLLCASLLLACNTFREVDDSDASSNPFDVLADVDPCSLCGQDQECVNNVCVQNCPAGFERCGEVCQDLNNNDQHCGACGEVCEAGYDCVNGGCALSCPPNLSECSGTCVDTQNSFAHCGTCEQACNTAEVCSEGTCVSTCSGNLEACDGSCVDLSTNLTHCGVCGNNCSRLSNLHACENANCVECPELFAVDPAATQQPTPHHLDVAQSPLIRATLNCVVNPSSLTPNTVHIHGSQTAAYTGNITSEDTRGALFTLPSSSTFKPGERITVSMLPGVVSAVDTPLTPYQWSFDVEATAGSATFTQGQRIASARSSIQNVVLGDLNSDSHLDLLLLEYGDASIWLGDGTGTFTESSASLGDATHHNAVLGDLNGDGHLDILDIVFDAPACIWLGDGSGTFTDSGQALGSNGQNTDAALGDVDGDGDLDALTANLAGSAQLWLNDGTGTFTESGVELIKQATGTAFADIDTDGDLDILVSGVNVGIFLNEGNLTFTPGDDPVHLGLDLETGDLDGDGDLDLDLISSTGSFGDNGNIWIQTNRDGAGDLTASSPSSTRFETLYKGQSIALADVDSDGDLDIVSREHLLINDGSGAFTDITDAFGAAPTDITAVTVGDVDENGSIDIIFASSEGIRVWKNN